MPQNTTEASPGALTARAPGGRKGHKNNDEGFYGKDFQGEELMAVHVQRPGTLSSGRENVRQPPAGRKPWEQRDVQGEPPTAAPHRGDLTKKSQIIPSSHPGLRRVSAIPESNAKPFNEVN